MSLEPGLEEMAGLGDRWEIMGLPGGVECGDGMFRDGDAVGVRGVGVGERG